MSSSSDPIAGDPLTPGAAVRPVVVIGVGNVLLTDEGVEVHMVRAAQEAAGDLAGVEFLDLGSGGLALLHAISDRRKVVIVDCAFMGEPPGTLRRFLPEEVRSTKLLSGISLHEGDVLQLLDLARQLGSAPAEVVILGIQPADNSPGLSLSPLLQANLDAYVGQVLREIQGAPSDGQAPPG